MALGHGLQPFQTPLHMDLIRGLLERPQVTQLRNSMALTWKFF